MTNSRTLNVTKNVIIAISCQSINLVLSFVSRSYFVSFLGAKYLGLNGLFVNILTILSFAELGIGNAIIFSLYKPIAMNDRKKISALMNFYKTTYRFIAILVFIGGLCIIPFLNYIINDNSFTWNEIIIVYFLFLLNTVSSYVFTYKKFVLYK